MKLGTLIREKREQKGISLRKLAKICGVSPTYISNIENNKIDAVSEAVMYIIARELDFDADTIVVDMGKIPAWVKPYVLQNWPIYKEFIQEDLSLEEWERLRAFIPQCKIIG